MYSSIDTSQKINNQYIDINLVSEQITKIPIIDWIACKDELLKMFSEREILQAIRMLGITTSKLTDRYSEYPEGVTPSYPHVLTETFQVRKYSREDQNFVYSKYCKYCTPSHYQANEVAQIINFILSMRYEYFSWFDWSIYANSIGEDYEIYMKTSEGSLYVPVKAFTEGFEVVRERMISYWKDYLNKKPENFQKYCLDVLASNEAFKLEAAMNADVKATKNS